MWNSKSEFCVALAIYFAEDGNHAESNFIEFLSAILHHFDLSFSPPGKHAEAQAATRRHIPIAVEIPWELQNKDGFSGGVRGGAHPP